MTPAELRQIDAKIAERVFGWTWLCKAHIEPHGTVVRRAIFPPENSGWIRWNFNPAHWGKSDKSEPLFSDWDRCCSGFDGEKSIPPFGLPHYTTDPAAAFSVLEKCAEKYRTEIGKCEGKFFAWAMKVEGDNAVELFGQADTLPLAICIFALEVFK